MYYFFSFSSRNNAFRFADAVVAAGGSAKIVNSPVTVGTGCSLAVRCDNYRLCSDLLNYGYYSALIAVYEFDGKKYNPIYNASD